MWAVILNEFFHYFHRVQFRTLLGAFLVRYLEQVHPHTPISVLRAGKPEKQPIPFLRGSCPRGAYSASRYPGDVVKTHGRKNPLPIMVHEPTVSDVATLGQLLCSEHLDRHCWETGSSTRYVSSQPMLC